MLGRVISPTRVPKSPGTAMWSGKSPSEVRQRGPRVPDHRRFGRCSPFPGPLANSDRHTRQLHSALRPAHSPPEAAAPAEEEAGLPHSRSFFDSGLACQLVPELLWGPHCRQGARQRLRPRLSFSWLHCATSLNMRSEAILPTHRAALLWLTFGRFGRARPLEIRVKLGPASVELAELGPKSMDSGPVWPNLV